MDNKLIITKQDNTILSAFFEGTDMVQVSINTTEEASILGNIYLGKVKNIVKNINAAFVEIADGRMCYISLEENHYPIMAGSDPVERKLQEVKLKIGDELIVQVTKEDIKTKAPVVNSNINFTGKYAALVYGKITNGVSSKINDEKERNRLRSIAKRFEQKDYSFIIRTNAAYMQEEKITDEMKILIEAYENIRNFGIHKSRFSLLYKAWPTYICDIRDGYAENVEEFLTDDPQLYENIRAYLKNYQPEDLGKLRIYEDATCSLPSLYGLSDKLNNAVRPMVWLKSGGSLVIQPTEALTVIDVNTGKAVAGRKKVQETFLKINREAAKEIAHQIRLRNLSGIIIIDFIDMELQKDKELLMEELREYFKKDSVKTTLVDMTSLGLVEVTRKKVRKPLHQQLAEHRFKQDTASEINQMQRSGSN